MTDLKTQTSDVLFSDSDSDEDLEIPKKKTFIEKKYTRIIGKAGVGKSTYILENFSRDDYLLTAFTGMAAARLETKTLASMFCLGFESGNSVKLATSIIYRCKGHHEIRSKRGLVIDEYYTLPADSMIKVDAILQDIMGNYEPFGGLEVILVGDDRQTAAVDENAFVDSELYKSMEPFKEIFLPNHPKMRLKPIYMKFCDKFRNPKLKISKILKYLSDPRFSQNHIPDGVTVYHENKNVDYRNKKEMEEFEGESLGLIRNVHYKKGCPIIITNNGKDIYNGMMGKLLNFDPKSKIVEIEFDDYVLETALKNVKFAPAFAVTIHKCQAATYRSVNLYIDPKKIARNREDNIRLIYVALTRVSRFSKCYVCTNIREF